MVDRATALAITADAAAYVPYAGAERVLASLEEWVADAEVPVRVLCGAHGSGKSMVLAVLAARVGRYAVPICTSANGLDPETLARTILDALGTPWEGTPRVALARAIEQPGARRLLLILDDAEALAPRTEMWVFDLVRRSAGTVHALLAVRGEQLAAEYARAFQVGTAVLALDAPMSPEEAEAWIRTELARSGADAVLRARLDAPTMARLHARSGGMPGRLLHEAAAIGAPFAAGRSEPIASTDPKRAAEHRESPSRPVDLSRLVVHSKPPRRRRSARRRRRVPRWLRVPVGIVVAFAVGFLTSQLLEAMRPGAASTGLEVVEVAELAPPPVSAPPPSQVEDTTTPPHAAATEAETAALAPPRIAAASPSPRRSVEVNVEAETGASIRVNGQPVGTGVVKGLELAPGQHLLEVRLPDGRSVERVIDVKGTRYDVKVQ